MRWPAQCNAPGWDAADTGEALLAEELVTQLSLRLQFVQRQIEELKQDRATGPGALYQEATAWVPLALITQGIKYMMTRKPAGRPLVDTEYLLEQWGWWRMDGNGMPGCISPSFALMREANPQPSNSINYCISDDWALAVDNAVAKLSTRDQQLGDILRLYFGAKWPMLRVGKYYCISEGRARELARAGVAWVDCALSDMRQAA